MCLKVNLHAHARGLLDDPIPETRLNIRAFRLKLNYGEVISAEETRG